jgi:nucleoside-diphosphate-sugar epimerase
MDSLLVVGCGDVARRALPALLARWRVTALVRRADETLAALGVGQVVGDLDRPESLATLGQGFSRVLHLAPPPEAGAGDPRTAHLAAALESKGMLPERLVYISTSGVYGDCRGERFDETRPVNPRSARGQRRVDAERLLLDWGAARGVNVSVLRVPGIYAADRLPLERLKRGTPVLAREDDVYTNHIHADDLAAICVAALERAAPGGVYHASDDSELHMGDWFDLVADRFGLPRPPRIPRAEAERVIPPMLLSFMSESRRLVNARMKRDLGVTLRYPTVFEGVPHGHPAGHQQPA